MNVSRGPSPSSKDWMNARFQLVEGDCRRILNSQDADEDDIADMEVAQQLLEQLRHQLDSFFPLEREEFSLYLDDISRHNLIVDLPYSNPSGLTTEFTPCLTQVICWQRIHQFFFTQND